MISIDIILSFYIIKVNTFLILVSAFFEKIILKNKKKYSKIQNDIIKQIYKDGEIKKKYM